MSAIDILLINLPTGSWYKDKIKDTNSMPPLGLLYIASYLEKYNYKVKVLDFAVTHISSCEFEQLLLEGQPKIVGLSTYNESWSTQKVLCKLVKKVLPDAVISAGGAFASFCYEDILLQSLTDVVQRGEGEYIFKALADFVIRDNKWGQKIEIDGICYRDPDGNIIVNKDSCRIQDLDNIPFPNRDLLELDKYIMPYTISTSRGCPGNCIFCSSRAFWGKQVIMRSAKSVFDEVMDIYHKYGVTIFYITDDTFTASKKRCLDFCKMLKETGINFIWGCESRADVIDESFIEILYQAGCHKIQFGFESADNEILKKLRKHVTIEQIENAVKCACKIGMHIQTSYIIGHAFDTNETIEKTLSYAKYFSDKYGARVVCSVNTPFPGTEQYEKMKELGISVKTKDWSKYLLNNPIISTKNLTTNELRNYLAKGQKLIK
ncbi:B12-binding domain-containing radical SAM protein [Lacrimispora amygdalina]|uniref:B12-binding domain-containing radical SAM protein n=1 Tax=Lacrimispora amygdalina TaxID=253257 RepID=UPI000BE24DC5|nr:radical SAM protein [Lacrimispora amygdalina]